MKREKDGKVYFVCDTCNKKLPKNVPTCPICAKQDEDAVKAFLEFHKGRRKERMKRMKKSFEEAFDEGCQQLAFKKLQEVKQITIKDLIAALKSDGFFDKIMASGGLQFSSYQDEWTWMYRRTLNLAKWWHKEGAAFIGCLIAKGVKGHPYLIFLPGQVPSDVIEIKTTADWSVKQTMKYEKSDLAEKLKKIREEMGLDS